VNSGGSGEQPGHALCSGALNPKFASFDSARQSELRIQKGTGSYDSVWFWFAKPAKEPAARHNADLRTTTPSVMELARMT
jgi:hypothetical protein